MATHSSILSWRIPWTEEPGRLQSIASQRVGHDWSNLAHNAYYCQTLFIISVNIFTCLILTEILLESTIIIPILEMRRQRHKMVEWPAQDNSKLQVATLGLMKKIGSEHRKSGSRVHVLKYYIVFVFKEIAFSLNSNNEGHMMGSDINL